ncbi:hypothetical protein [Candidatus Amarolinea dominans]
MLIGPILGMPLPLLPLQILADKPCHRWPAGAGPWASSRRRGR